MSIWHGGVWWGRGKHKHPDFWITFGIGGMVLHTTLVIILKRPPKIKEDTFSLREQEILAIVGKCNRQEMADQLFLSIKTVDFHLKNLRDKTNTSSMGELVRYAIQHGFQEG